MIRKLKYFFTGIFLLAISAGSFAHVGQDEAQLTRKEKRQVQREQMYQVNKSMLENRSFVLESDFLQNRYGMRIPVNSIINFVLVDEDEAIIQIGSHSGMGYNGVGGITAKGRITKWEVNENERKKTFTVRMHVMTNIGMYDVNFSVGSFGATARLTGLRPGNLTFTGDMVMLEESTIYEGRSL
jgi:hypothetical protein